MTTKETPIIETVPAVTGMEHGGNGATGIIAPPASSASTIMPETPRLADEADMPLITPRRNRWRVVIPTILVVALAIGAAYVFLTPKGGALTTSVRRGTIISTVETTGKIEAERSAKLSFKQSGRVDEVIARQGDAVKKGDVLAILDTSNLQRQINEAKVQLEISKLKLQQANEGAQPADIAAATADLNGAVAQLNSTRSGGRAEDIAAAQAQVNQAQAKLDGLRKGSSAQDIAQAEAAVREAQAKMASLKAGPTQQDIDAAQANVNQAQAALDKAKAPATAQDITAAQSKVDQAKANRDQVAATASNAKEQARIAMDQAANAMRNAEDAYGKIKNDNDQISPKNLTNDQKQAEEKALRDLQDAQGKLAQAQLSYDAAKKNEIAQLNAADAQITEAQAALDKLNAGPTQADIAAAQAGVDAAKARLAQVKAGPKPEDIAAAQAGVDQAQEALNKLKAGPTSDDIQQSQEAVNQAKANLDKVKRGATANEIKEAQSKVDGAQAALDKVKSGPTATDKQILEQQINLAQISVDNASGQLTDAQLVSPIDGTVLSIDLDVGEIIGQLQPVATIADTSSLRIKADIDEIDVGRVQAGQPVTVTLDAYPGVKMSGKIDTLAPGATLKQGSTVYQATISFTPTEGVIPREGMASNVDVTAQRKDNVLLLPNRAFETVGTREYVTLTENGSTRKVEVETGLTNATDTEVISGLSEGQMVTMK